MEARPIPAFYCCYLLRSTKKKSAIYVGSTPNPLRRLAQHNGDTKGGAVRTRTLRPWEMTSIVAGFPSKIAALQFEWAWNNPHITKRIANEQRITLPAERSRKSPRTGRTRKQIRKPPMTLDNKLSNLHLLLRVPSFSRWPLQVRFFCEDVYQSWQSGRERANANIRNGIKILLDSKQPEEIVMHNELPVRTKAKSKRKRELSLGKGGIEGLDIGYSELKGHIEKSVLSLAGEKAQKCAVCAKDLDSKTAMALVCPQKDCGTASHLTCLAAKFIRDEGADAAVTPISGLCPRCKVELQWIDLIKELSLRTRGHGEVVKITKRPKACETNVPKRVNAVVSQAAAQASEEVDVTDSKEDLVKVDIHALDPSDESLPDDWRYQDDDDDDMMSVMSGPSALLDGIEDGSPTKQPSAVPKLPAVIQDSELDDTEFSD